MWLESNIAGLYPVQYSLNLALSQLPFPPIFAIVISEL